MAVLSDTGQTQKDKNGGRAQWLTPVIPATQEAEGRRTEV
jgi:hypothetical protein